MMQTYKWSDMVERINMNISWGPEQNKQDHALMDRLTATEPDDHEMQLILSHLITFPAF